MIDRSIVGREYPPFSFEIERSRVLSYAEDNGEIDPVHLDERVALAAGFRSLAVPPTLAYAAILERNRLFMVLNDLGIEKCRTMNAKHSFAWYGDLYAGDVLHGRQRIVDIYDKEDGALECVVCETTCTNQLGKPVCGLRTTIDVRK